MRQGSPRKYFGLVSDWNGTGEAAKGQLLDALRNPVSRLVDRLSGPFRGC